MATLKSYNPSDGELVGEVAIAAPDQIPAFVDRARTTQPAWESLGREERASLLAKAAETFAEQADDLGRLITEEMGKPLSEGIAEAKSLASVKEELEEIGEALAPEVFDDGRNHSTVYHDALGVCAAITPWNFPMSMPHWMVLPALAAGNTVILKPSEETPLCGQAYADVLNSALPPDVLQVVHGADDQGERLVASALDLIAFTGSRETGKHILRSASGELNSAGRIPWWSWRTQTSRRRPSSRHGTASGTQARCV